ncbi:hypothetical protein GQ55_9G344800 [Panicum hallii var. hallii]|uniref:Uncharacterized protein n=1 Tax=Panicum hallii var. hallii TaxID=1504633 RepID=A0A2T7C8I3_9POAL|nr:hypothetical protein GQ55_9G344800 [Panicum hallii var. hallii]
MDTAAAANLLHRGHSASIRFDGLLGFSFHGPRLLRAAFNLCRISGGSCFFAERSLYLTGCWAGVPIGASVS